jgi:hypothetical protein
MEVAQSLQVPFPLMAALQRFANRNLLSNSVPRIDLIENIFQAIWPLTQLSRSRESLHTPQRRFVGPLPRIENGDAGRADPV